MAKGVRQGCFAFDPIFRWIQEVVIPRNPDNLDILQLDQCAYADDLAVAASSFRDLMTALAPAFHSVDHIAGLNLNYRKCCWVQYGPEERESLWHWISENCEEFREMQIVRYAKYVGTMIGPDGYIYRWAASRKNRPARAENQCVYQKPGSAVVRLQDLYDFCAEFCWIRMRTRQGDPEGREPCPSSVPLQDRTTLYLLTFLEFALYVVLVLIWWVFTPPALRLDFELLHAPSP